MLFVILFIIHKNKACSASIYADMREIAPFFTHFWPFWPIFGGVVSHYAGFCICKHVYFDGFYVFHASIFISSLEKNDCLQSTGHMRNFISGFVKF